MRPTLLAAVLILSAPLLAADAPPPVAAEVEKGVKAYNAHDVAYYEGALSADAVYIAEDGAVFAGKERVLRLFSRIFAMTPPRQLAVTDLAGGTRGDVAWARFKWTLTAGPDSRHGVSSILFVRAADAWQVLQIQNTPAGHVMAASPAPASPVASPSPSPSPRP
jgi:ketosteroid isomerase-like protein